MIVTHYHTKEKAGILYTIILQANSTPPPISICQKSPRKRASERGGRGGRGRDRACETHITPVPERERPELLTAAPPRSNTSLAVGRWGGRTRGRRAARTEGERSHVQASSEAGKKVGNITSCQTYTIRVCQGRRLYLVKQHQVREKWTL